MVISGIDRLFINVPDLDKALEFYQGTVGMSVAAKGTVDLVVLKDLWGHPQNVTARFVCVKNARQPTAIQIVELRPAPKEGVWNNARAYDCGLFDVTYLVSDIKKVEQLCRQKGYQFLTDPYRFPPWPGGIESSMGFIKGPAGEAVGIVQLFNPLPTPEQRLDGDFWMIMDMAQQHESLDEALKFYRDALGLTVVSDNTAIQPDFLDALLHLPKGTKPHIVMFNHPQSKAPVVETVEFSVKGKPISATPQKLGIFMVSFESADLDGELAKVKGRGFKVISGPVQVESPLHGKVRAADVEGPSKIRVELFQKA